MADVVESSRQADGLPSVDHARSLESETLPACNSPVPLVCFALYNLPILCLALYAWSLPPPDATYFEYTYPEFLAEEQPAQQKAATSNVARRDALTALGFRAGYSPTKAEIRNAYKQRVLQHHPDKNPHDPAAAAKFISLKAAFDFLNGV